MNNTEHTLLCILGRTASGKDSLVSLLCKKKCYKQLISYTTRSKRYEDEGTHIFVTEEDYNRMQADGQVAAFTQIGRFMYWCTIDQLYESDVYIIDYEGLKTLRNLNLPNLRLVSVFVNVPDDIRESRALNKRKDDRATFRARNLAERGQFREMTKELDFDYMIPNIDISKACSVLNWIATAEGLWKNRGLVTE